MPIEAVAQVSPWVLRFDLASGRALLWIVTARRAGEVYPEVYLYLADRYWRLAAHYEKRGRPRKAQRLAGKAKQYLDLGGGRSFAASGGSCHANPTTPELHRRHRV